MSGEMVSVGVVVVSGSNARRQLTHRQKQQKQKQAQMPFILRSSLIFPAMIRRLREERREAFDSAACARSATNEASSTATINLGSPHACLVKPCLLLEEKRERDDFSSRESFLRHLVHHNPIHVCCLTPSDESSLARDQSYYVQGEPQRLMEKNVENKTFRDTPSRTILCCQASAI